VTTTSSSENSSLSSNSLAAFDDISFIETLLCLNDDSRWHLIHEMLSQSLGDGNADEKPLVLFDLSLLVFSSLSQVVTQSLQTCFLEGKFSPRHHHQQLVGALVRVCWCCVRFRFPRLSDLHFLFTRMSLSESILVAEVCVETLRSRNTRHEGDSFLSLPSSLGSVTDFVIASLTNWETRGIFEGDQLMQLPSCVSPDSAAHLDSSLEQIRCHWVAILYLLGVRNQSLGSGE
jgi:hypothetical protein